MIEEMKQEDLIKQLLISYSKEIQPNHPFLLFDIAHVNENDHTRVLLNLLRYDNFKFLQSFLELIGAPTIDNTQKTEMFNQMPTQGNIGKGFADLYIRYVNKNNETIKVIIENKIYGASDTDNQLARYIYSAIDNNQNFESEYDNSFNNNSKFEQLNEKWQKGETLDGYNGEKFKNIYVVYLTSDGSKTPKGSSFPSFFRSDKDGKITGKHVNYCPINYLNDIIPWLENEVLPIIPYSDDGIMIAGVRQYLESLKSMFRNTEESESISNFTEELFKKSQIDGNGGNDNAAEKYKIKKKYYDIISSSAKSEKGEESEQRKDLQPILRDLRAASMELFSHEELDGDWKLYFNPTNIHLYRQKWADLDVKKYSIPSISFVASASDFLNGNLNQLNWLLQIDHVNKDEIKGIEPPKISITGSTVKFSIGKINGLKSSQNMNNKDTRKTNYTDIITELGPYIKKINDCLKGINSNNDKEKFQIIVIRKLNKCFEELKT